MVLCMCVCLFVCTYPHDSGAVRDTETNCFAAHSVFMFIYVAFKLVSLPGFARMIGKNCVILTETIREHTHVEMQHETFILKQHGLFHQQYIVFKNL